jgi:hypothetical protein
MGGQSSLFSSEILLIPDRARALTWADFPENWRLLRRTGKALG